MKYYSNNYCNIKSNYVVFNIVKKEVLKEYEYIKSVKVLKNILTRGNVIIPSKYLINTINYDYKSDTKKDYLFPNANIKNEWSNIIKGSIDYNPALDFYNDFPILFSQYDYVQNLIKPEELITNIIKSDDEFVDERVDFYIPVLKLAIEIDGNQHEASIEHDKKRDNAIRNTENKVIRFTTTELRSKNNSYFEKIGQIKKMLDSSVEIKNYYNSKKLTMEKEALTYICRLEMIILELLLTDNISLENNTWNFNIVNDMPHKYLTIAYEDIKLWLICFLKLRKLDFEYPKLNIDNSNNSIKIDVDIYKRYDADEIRQKDIIYSRTDYYDDENYFKIESDESINYNLEGIPEEKKLLNWLLSNIFGFERFRPGQLKIIKTMLNLKKAIGILPTGSGKSLCYQFSALLQPAVTFVICPLVSLIKDQYDNMKKIGITNIQKIDSSNTGIEKNIIMNSISEGESIFTWISPERFQIVSFRESILKLVEVKKINVAYFVIDEVHCLSEWGHDFRIAYLQLTKIARQVFKNTTLIGLTATLSSKVLSDIKYEFGYDSDDYKGIIVGKNFSRNELYFNIINTYENAKKKTLDNILNLIDYKNLDGDILVFTPFKNGKRGCIALSNQYKKIFKQFTIEYFSGANTKEEHSKNNLTQDRFKNNEIKLLFATKSFGMGIDKSNIRYTIHYGMSSSMDSLYQEVGRAGRDGKKAICAIIHAKDMFNLNDQIIKNNKFDIETYSNEKNWSQGDVCDQLTLFTSEINNYYNEAKSIYNFYKSLKKENTNLIISFTNFIKQSGNNEEKINKKLYCENILYKLYLLGIVKDWTINYKENTFNIDYLIIDEENVKNHLIKYIKKDDVNFDINNIKNEELEKQFNNNKIHNYILLISFWYYNNITYRKIREISNLDYALNNYNTDDKFKKYIKQYYTLDDNAIFLDLLSDTPLDYFEALKIFYKKKNYSENLVSIVEIEKLSIILDRFIIENQYIESYHFLEYLTKIILNRNSHIMKKKFIDLLKENKDDRIIIQLLNILKLCHNNSKESIIKEIIKIKEDIKILIEIYERYPYEEALNKILKIELEKLSKTKEIY